MRLSDVMSGAPGLSVYAQVAVVVSVTTFVALLLHLFVFQRRSTRFREAARLPFDESHRRCRSRPVADIDEARAARTTNKEASQ